MTKDDFLRWLERFRHIDNIKTVVEQRIWTEAELDRLKDRLESAGRLEMKNTYRRRLGEGY